MAVHSIDSNELVFQKASGKSTTMTRSDVHSNTAYKSLEQMKKTRISTDQRKHKTRLVSKLRLRQSPLHSHYSLRANIFLISLSFVLYLAFNQHSTSVEACLCHLIPNFQCPPPPHCCESGQYAKDECGCCLTCAKSELQPCGGPSGAHGKCASGLQCLKTCTACTILSSLVDPEPCVFPFVYDKVEYHQCTSVDAVNPGTVWCATEVDPEYNNTVIDGRWGDCSDSCPGARRECNDKRFEIIVGECVNPAVPGAIPNWFGAPAIRLLDKTEQLFPAPFCKKGGKRGSKIRPKYKDTCHCAEGQDAFEITRDGTVRGNCTGVDGNTKDGHDPVWCFLENVRDPSNSKSGCYSDTTWSAKDGRFWSARACDGLPPIDGGEFTEVDPSELIRAAVNQPFQKPDRLSSINDRFFKRTTTRRPRRTTTRRTTTALDDVITTTRRPRRTTTRRTTTTVDDIEDYPALSQDEEDEDLVDNIVSNERVRFLNERPRTTQQEDDYISDYDDLVLTNERLDQSFGLRETTAENFDAQTIEHDYATGDGEDFPEEIRSSRLLDGGPAIRNIDYNDADLDYLYDYYHADDYDDHLMSQNDGSQRQKQHGSGIKAISDFPNGKDDNHGRRGGFLVDLPIVNQRENGVEFFPTPSSTDNRRKFTTLTARDFSATKFDKFNDQRDLGFGSAEGDDPPPLTTARTNFPGQPTTPIPFEFGAKLSRAKSRFANRFKFNRNKFLKNIQEKTNSFKFINTKKTASIRNNARKPPRVQDKTEDYDDPFPRTTARSILDTTTDPAPRPTTRHLRLRITTSPSTEKPNPPEPSTTAALPKGILGSAIAENRKRIRAQILRQKVEIKRAGIIPPPKQLVLLNTKPAFEVKAAELQEKPKLQTEEVKPRQLQLVDTEELLSRLKSKSSTTKASTTVSTQGTTQKTTAEISADGTFPQHGIVGGLSVKLSTPRAEITTLPPARGESITAAISHSTTSIKEPTITTTKTPSSNTEGKARKLSPTIETAINSGSSLEEVLANLPKEKLDAFKQYLLTLDNEDRKSVSKKLQKNLENAKKFKTTTKSTSQVEDGEPVIDLGILGSFRLEIPKRTVFEDELFDNQIRTERPSPVFRPQEHPAFVQ